MARRSNKSIEATLSSTKGASSTMIDRKISSATKCFTTSAKSSELILRDRSRLSEENALAISEYIISMKREINPKPNTIRTTIQFLYELSKSVGNIEKRFEDMTRDDVLLYLDSNRKSENYDPLHKWIGSYNTKRVVLFRFFKWLYYTNVDTPEKRNELSAAERNPEC
ncbi:MAG TPA: hypothetical protein VFJ05_07150, partial [Nitrososphaeraceae archaeon]|nr:hypothetical protein [Nitrososphaeraceae archaeon]